MLTLMLTNAGTAADIGDAAPPLRISEWVHGKAVSLDQLQGKQNCVIVFWETGCDACVGSLPRLTELQRKYQPDKVLFLGISGEAVGVVKPFVEKMGERLDIAVGLDDDRSTYGSYMTAFGKSVIPHAFLVDKRGKIAWQGHPLAGLETAIEDLQNGRFDIETSKRVTDAERMVQPYFIMAAKGSDDVNARAMGERILADGATNPWLLNNFAWQILTDTRVKVRDRDLALRAAKLAFELTAGRNPAFADTYARALFDSGKTEEAVATQKHAIAVCKDSGQRASLELTLQGYQKSARTTE